MRSQWCNTYEEGTNTMWCDTIYPYYDAVRFDFDSIQHKVIQYNMMQWKKIWCYAIQYGT